MGLTSGIHPEKACQVAEAFGQTPTANTDRAAGRWDVDVCPEAPTTWHIFFEGVDTRTCGPFMIRLQSLRRQMLSGK